MMEKNKMILLNNRSVKKMNQNNITNSSSSYNKLEKYFEYGKYDKYEDIELICFERVNTKDGTPGYRSFESKISRSTLLLGEYLYYSICNKNLYFRLDKNVTDDDIKLFFKDAGKYSYFKDKIIRDRHGDEISEYNAMNKNDDFGRGSHSFTYFMGKSDRY